MTTIVEPAGVAQLDEVRKLVRAFVEWARGRYAAEIEFVERYFDKAAFEAELNGLPGKYSRPTGRLLLALHDGKAAGCVAFRDIGEGVCEMKRLYVDDQHHGRGIGRSLVSALIVEARLAGYSSMRLDTGPNQIEAVSLYRSFGFRVVEPYYELPAELREWLVFMELNLSKAKMA